jgi:hypothetical protein
LLLYKRLEAGPMQYVGRHDWDTCRTKVIDNAIVGFIRSLHNEVKKNS